MYLNRAFVFGNLTRDPELRTLPSGVSVTTFGLATNRVWKDKNGAKQEDTQFHNIVVFGQQASLVAQYLRKGNTALVEGRMQTRSWDGQDGVKKYRTEIVADRVQFGPRGGERGGASSAGGVNQAANAPQDGGSQINYPEENISPEDIPF